MIGYNDQRYSEGSVSFPNRDIDPREKDAEYDKAWASAIYNRYYKNKAALPKMASEVFEVLRSYAEGRQDTTKYKSWLIADSDEKGTGTYYDDDIGATALGRKAKREGWVNVLFDVVSPAPKITDAILGLLRQYDFDIVVDAIDPESKELQEDEKWRKIVRGKFMDWMTDYKRKAGIPIDDNEPLPSSEEEFDMYFSAEGFKLGIAKAMQKLIRWTIDSDSKWDPLLFDKFVRDLIANGITSARNIYDVEDRRFKLKYIDPAYLTIQYSKDTDYSDAEWAGYFSEWTISNLKLKMPWISDEEWHKLANKYLGVLGNPNSITSNKGVDYIDDFKVYVYDVEWIDTDYKKGLYYKSAYGRETYHRVSYNYQPKPLSEGQIKEGIVQELRTIPYRYLRGCKWVVGTDYVFDNGPINMAARPKMSKPMLTFIVVETPGPSITERLYPVYDMFMMAWLRHQNSVAQMIERGYAVDMGMLMNVTDGDGKKWSWDDIMSMWKQKGILPYQTSINGAYAGGAITPIHEIGGGLGDRIRESIEMFKLCSDMILEITGIDLKTIMNPVDPSSPVVLNNVLKPMLSAIGELKQLAADTLMRRIKIGIRNDADIRKSYAGIIGAADMEAIRVSEGRGAEYGLSLRARPGAEYRERLRKYIETAMQVGRNGNPGLTIDQAMYLEERLDNGGDLIEIRQRVSYYIKKAQEEAWARQQSNIVAQGEQQRKLAAENDSRLVEIEKLKARLKMLEDESRTLNNLKEKRFVSNSNMYMKLLEQATGKEKEAANV